MVLTLVEEIRDRDERDRWTNTEELLAQVHELLQLLRTEQLAAAGVKSGALPDIRRIPRPGDPPPEERTRAVSPREAALLTRGG